MKISVQWLNDYIDHKLKPQDLAERLTMAGLEVEEMTAFGATQVLQMEITPNRPDCLSVLGIAREVSAICQKHLKFPQIKKLPNASPKISISIDDKQACGRYIGAVIKDVQVKESPTWLKERIEALGLKSINNIVDITNFCLMEMGQPLHAFDYDKLTGGQIQVRRARSGEELKTLDGQTHKLSSDFLVIADGKQPVALAGIMGGYDSQITVETKNILLESAHFSFGLIRRTTRAVGLNSDSSYRFERGVHWDTIERCSNRAIDLILNIAGGKLDARRDVVSQKPKAFKRTITLPIQEINDLLGFFPSEAKCKSILSKLGFGVKSAKKGVFKIDVPDHRQDVAQPADVIEEIARIIGFDHLPMTVPQIKALNIPEDSNRSNLKKSLYQRLLAQGCDEIITYSMTNQKNLEKSSQSTNPPLKIVNPLSQEQELMRPSLLPSFLSVVLGNVNRSEKNLRFFEFGRIYSQGAEKETIGILLAGEKIPDWRSFKREPVDIFDLKGIVEQTLMPLSKGDVSFRLAEFPALEIGQSVQCNIGSLCVGYLGRVSANILNKWDIKTVPVFFAQLDLQEMYGINRPPIKFVPIVDFPSVVRDVSLAVKLETAYDQIREICFSFGGDILKSVRFVEQYVGDKIQTGYRGIVFSLTYQSFQGTLKEETVNAVHEKICNALIAQLGAVKR